MCCRRSTFLRYRLLQSEHYRHATEASQCHVAEVIHVGPQTRLSTQGLIDKSIGALQGCRGRGSLGAQICLHALDGSLDRDTSRSERMDQFVAMNLFVPRDNRVHHGDSNAASDIAQQIIEAAGIADLFVLQERH